MLHFKVDVERPYEGIKVMELDEARKLFELDKHDIQKLKDDKIVWVGEIAISKSEEQDEEVPA